MGSLLSNLQNRIQATPNYHQMSFGLYGFRVIQSGFSATAGDVFAALQVIEDADITATNDPGGDNLTGAVTFAAGSVIYGEFQASSVSVTTGTVIGYMAKRTGA